MVQKKADSLQKTILASSFPLALDKISYLRKIVLMLNQHTSPLDNIIANNIR